MKKGFTVLEIIIATGLSAILIIWISYVFLMYNSYYKTSTEKYRETIYCTEALMFIEDEINNSNNVTVTNNTVELTEAEGNNKNYIYQKNNSIVIAYKVNDDIKAVNKVINNIKDFYVIQKEKTIYVTLINNNGVKYERCFGVRI